MAQGGKYPTERFLDAANEPTKRLSPIEGYELNPLVSLEEAVRPLESIIKNIQSYVWTATGNSDIPNDGLSLDESAAIYLYTMECMYRQLNTALRSEQRQVLIPYFSYLKLLLTALWKLEDVKEVVWRGVKGNLADQYPTGKKFVWWGFSSCTHNLDVLQKKTFLDETAQRTLFNIQCFNGKMIQNHSHYPTEKEVLLLPCSSFEVMGNIRQGADLQIIHIKQVEPPVVLIQPPSFAAVPHFSTEAFSVRSNFAKMSLSQTPMSSSNKITVSIPGITHTSREDVGHNDQKPNILGSEEEIYFHGGNLLTSEQQKKLNEFYGKNEAQWQLIYKATKDGFAAKDFHRQCDGKGPTITIIKSKNDGYLFGGFIVNSWSSDNGRKTDPTAFLFTLKNPRGQEMTKFKIQESQTEFNMQNHHKKFAAYHYTHGGPIFGGVTLSIWSGSLALGFSAYGYYGVAASYLAADICVQNNCHLNKCTIDFPQAFKDTLGHGNTTFTGPREFYCDDIEVYRLN